MKNLFRAATNWLKQSKSEETPQPEAAETPRETLKPVPVPAPAEPKAMRPAPEPAAPPAKRERRVEAEEAAPKPAPVTLASLNAGPEVKLFTRASKTYATCPHCEASWNLRERIAHPSFRRDESKGLTCPACDKGVSLPSTLDLRKLS